MLVLFSLFFFVVNVNASTSVGGLITSDTTWAFANSPYQLTESIEVTRGVTLVIESGVTVDLGVYDLIINGAVVAIGRDDSLIHVISQKDATHYAGVEHEQILFNNSENLKNPKNLHSIFDKVVFDKASIFVNDFSSPTIEYCIFNNPNYIAIFAPMGASNIYSNIFQNVTFEGISVGESATVIKNLFNATSRYGTAIIAHGNAYVSENKIFNFYNGITTDGETRIKGNSVVNCTNYGIWDTCSKSTIESNYVANNTIGINYEGSAKVVSNAVVDNKIGIYFSLCCPYMVYPGTICYNTIQNNIQDSIRVAYNSTVLVLT